LGTICYFTAFNDWQHQTLHCWVLHSPPPDLETLMHIDKAWRVCPTGAHPILVGNLNINLFAPCTECEETIAKQVDAMDVVDLSRHFYQCLGTRL
jgi:hypothetical protein